MRSLLYTQGIGHTNNASIIVINILALRLSIVINFGFVVVLSLALLPSSVAFLS
jgi:hypothetical protein